MTKQTIELITNKFKEDFDGISYEIRKNKREIKILASKQRNLKNLRKGLFEILSKIRGFG